MRLSLRFIIPLLLALAAFAYAMVPLVDRLTLQWFVRDIDIRSSLIANTVQEPLLDLVRAGNRNRIIQYFTRITLDERVYAMGFCASPQDKPVATRSLPQEIRCADLDTYAAPSEHLLSSDRGPLHVSVKPLEAEGISAGWIVIVHDMSFIARRSEETKKYLFYFFIGLGAVVSFITVVI
ncbi:MAG: trehalose-6-phosphate synthase, partial [Betaproteobacteria bacterium]|nr:trehalose-6-phosphate synthase [Betaproteobacteria bacterium]